LETGTYWGYFDPGSYSAQEKIDLRRCAQRKHHNGEEK
jgi:hypothetical protein